MTLRGSARSILKSLRRGRGRGRFSNGPLGSAEPLSRDFGYSRGTPIDRFYIEQFLEAHASDIRGNVLEIGDDSYSRRFGGSRITRQDVLHIDPNHPGATISGDLATAGVLPPGSFDCLIVTQTLHLIFDMQKAVEQLHKALRPGGVLLLTVPGITPVDCTIWQDRWFWSLTDQSVQRLLTGPFAANQASIRSYGNLYAATAFLHGAALEEVTQGALDPFDAAYPVIVAARATA